MFLTPMVPLESAGSRSGDGNARRFHILMVEDDDAHAKIVHYCLNRAASNLQIDRVSDGEKALEFVRGEGQFAGAPRPDVILLDLNLPRVSGHEVLRQLKSDEQLRCIPTIILSTSGSPADRERAYRNNVNSYLMKPYSLDQFQAMISEVVYYWSKWNQRAS